MTDLEKTKILLKTRKFPYTKEGIEALLLRLQTRGNLPEAIESVSNVLAEFGRDYTVDPAKKATKVAKKRTRGPNKKK